MMRICARGKLCLVLILVTCILLPTAAALGEALTHYILMGFDFWGEPPIENSSTDVNLLVTLDKENNRVLLTSITGDSDMPLPAGGYSKLNGIAREYDIQTYVKTLEQSLGIEIAGYAALTVTGFTRIINAMGGLEVVISSGEYESLVNRDIASDIPGPGTHVLQGKAVYSYLMDRYMGGDGAGTQEARGVAVIAIEQVIDMPWNEVLMLVSTVLEEINMNIPLSTILSELLAVYQMEGLQIEQFRLPIENAFSYETVNGSSAVQWIWEQNLDAFHGFLEAGESETGEMEMAK